MSVGRQSPAKGSTGQVASATGTTDVLLLPLSHGNTTPRVRGIVPTGRWMNLPKATSHAVPPLLLLIVGGKYEPIAQGHPMKPLARWIYCVCCFLLLTALGTDLLSSISRDGHQEQS